MSHYIDTTQASYGGSTGLSNRQRWEIIIGVIAAIALGVAAFAVVSSTDTLVADPVDQPVRESYAAADDLATRSEVPVALSRAAGDDLATRSVVQATPGATRLAGADDLATLPTVVEAQRYAGTDDLAIRSTGPRYAGSDDLASR